MRSVSRIFLTYVRSRHFQERAFLPSFLPSCRKSSGCGEDLSWQKRSLLTRGADARQAVWHRNGLKNDIFCSQQALPMPWPDLSGTQNGKGPPNSGQGWWDREVRSGQGTNLEHRLPQLPACPRA